MNKYLEKIALHDATYGAINTFVPFGYTFSPLLMEREIRKEHKLEHSAPNSTNRYLKNLVTNIGGSLVGGISGAMLGGVTGKLLAGDKGAAAGSAIGAMTGALGGGTRASSINRDRINSAYKHYRG